MKINFGGFVPLSTVDWRGRAVCTVFFRGCPVRCYYCHNREIQTGEELREIDEIEDMIRQSRLAISGVIFSGGEATMQKEALMELARRCRKMNLAVGVQTNGVFPDTLKEMIDEGLLDLVHLDIKTRWEHYPRMLKVGDETVSNIKRSLEICKKAHADGTLPEFQVVVTLFPGREEDVDVIAREANGAELVLQQGVWGSIPPLKFEDLKKIADKIKREVRIRTREDGEVIYDRNRITIAGSMVLTDINQARRK
ncbi:anaerobic ribonucleoside-triphosphate reductase activating protein [Methanolacinia paynteri]|uniref:anaerobic ribonucleoside-triphosphate reductase activating protein n=1 Tax=Methanolacinia paynteri TaxID=230356 RepID=UPI00064E9E58|nr:anaerobic ribonucleoside-triphosphate reductase activating protein [Methanolacinia paynteri]